VGAAAAADRAWMRRALTLAERGWGRVAPNPLVGAVLVRDGEVVGEGWHAELGMAHAEIMALREAGESARGATAYVTLEPCSHHGRTPPCTEALLAAGVGRLVFAAADPHPDARGGGDVLEAAGILVTRGIEEVAARDLNGAFFHRYEAVNRRRPWIELKLALSLDARVADASGRSCWITGNDARAAVHHLRAGHDAIAIGVGTALADDPRLTVRGDTQPRVPPVRVVFDRTLRLPIDSSLVRSAREIPVWIVTGADVPAEAKAALEAAGVEVLVATDLPTGLAALRDRGIDSLFCEGGAGIAAALLEADLVDRLSLFYAPILLGGGSLSPFAALPARQLEASRRWRHLRTQTFGSDTLITLARLELEAATGRPQCLRD
jgi:diaminohydroxyphosphoribosylaminopyrimidine deaminase/5-amino-6-(5-phosphoribosylamino)uracil reductase